MRPGGPSCTLVSATVTAIPIKRNQEGRDWMASSSKRQTTMAKLARERAVKEHRERKQEKKEARKLAAAEGGADAVTDETPPIE